MMFQPVVPLSGLAGWRVLQRTQGDQRALFADSAEVKRDTAHFREKIGEATTAEALVADRTALKVALGAFGLGDDLPKKALIRQVLEQGTENDDALANRFVDPRYRELADAFGYGNTLGARVGRPGFAADIVARYEDRAFEAAVGESDETMRLALYFTREVQTLAASPNADDAAWFSALGDKPLRRVLESALNLPSQFAQLDIDRQKEVIQDRMSDIVGSRSLAAFSDAEARDTIIRRFLAREQATQGPGPLTPGAGALAILQGAAGPGAIQNLVLSRF